MEAEEMDDIGLLKEFHLYRIVSGIETRRGNLESNELLEKGNGNTLGMRACSFEKRI